MRLEIPAPCLPLANSAARPCVSRPSRHSAGRRRFLVAVFAIVTAVMTSAVPLYASSVSFADGGTHTFDGFAESLTARDGAGFAPTTVRLTAPGDVPHLFAEEHSIVDILGGTVAHLAAKDNVQVGVFNGVISHLTAEGSPHVSVFDGVVSHLRARDNAQVNVFGGEISHLSAYDHSQVDIHGGTMDYAGAYGTHPSGPGSPPPPSQLTIHGGQVDIVKADFGGMVDIFGGDIFATNPSRSGIMHIYGGSIDQFTLNPDTYTYVYGSDMVLTPNGLVHDIPQYILTGFLQDGSPLLVDVNLPAGAVLQLITVPEPSALALLASGGVALMLGWRRNRPLRAWEGSTG